ncbi:MAG: cytochrome [Sphingomonas bacterium]|uniref:cytochrome b n=1 Tax=Sphingomonas bacterium TaxID=1895847 RepID=UPI002615045A|nr:cytochrome b [Sphingomonas bacterium]MDB5702939.1 cytochrome [Sphingomonas bacterium]
MIPQRQMPTDSYTPVAKVFHWAIVILVIVQFALAWTMPDVTRDTRPIDLIGWHLSVGAAILFVVLARLAWRLTHHAPAAPEGLPPVLKLVSRATHFLLYALLIVLPLMGWANAAARGWTVKLFSIVSLPPLVAKGSPLGRQMGDIHSTTAIIFLVVIALHVAGALYHALILRDRTLQRML